MINRSLQGQRCASADEAARRITVHPLTSVRENIGFDFAWTILARFTYQLHTRIKPDKIERITSARQRPFSQTSQLFVPLLVRRAKLGFVSRRQVPAPEALARHRVPSVASLSVTPAAKRTQGGGGPQCESVKGLSPVMNVNRGCRRR